MAAVCVVLFTNASPIPAVRAFAHAARMPSIMAMGPAARSASSSTTAAPRSMIFIAGFGFRSPLPMNLTYCGTRITPCDPMPRWSAQTRTSAVSVACASLIPRFSKMLRTTSRKCAGAMFMHQKQNMDPRLRGDDESSAFPGRKVKCQPIPQQVDHDRVALGEHEVIDARDEVQVGRLSGAREEVHRLLGRRHGVRGGMQEQQRARCDLADHVVGAEGVHALD